MLHLFRLQMETTRVMTEAQTVIGLRMIGMAGLVPKAQGETLRRVARTQSAFARAWIDGTQAMLRGGTPVGLAKQSARRTMSDTSGRPGRRPRR
ncbi:antifreeze protein [Jannaschia seohaensis]|uniref:Phasin protein n=1 Tax=Jannaschia seohaensis TaxID=475081 RepID=A0A2Y9AJA3_9RHOB|nr:antifreeze protein [Jannaschia seohaensis]PWJ20475.1 hypothetical protein BCF38_103293 [Jannaschia seohaensis]SSA44571.1 hypothetical protein SAMN05421539_103293 [Jannaschia seohaensis]